MIDAELSIGPLHRLADRARTVRVMRWLFGWCRRGTARIEDLWRGLSTEALIVPIGVTARRDAHLYVPLAYGQARRVLRILRLGPSDVVMDVGCGLGRLVGLAAQARVNQVIGLEFDPLIADAARVNMRSLRRRKSPASIVTMDAARADFDGVTVVVMFNPFGPSTMNAMLDQLRRSLDACPRTVRIAYVNPTTEQELRRCAWLTQVSVSRSARYRHVVSFWEA